MRIHRGPCGLGSLSLRKRGRAGPVRLLQDSEAERSAKLAALRQSIDTGLEELDRGDGFAADEVFEEILKALRSEAA